MSLMPCFPEPQNDLYWLTKREGNIRTCNMCQQKSLGIDIVGCIELDFSIKAFDDGSKQWKLSN